MKQRGVACLIVLVLLSEAALAQAVPSQHGAQVKAQVDKLATGDKLSVIPFHAAEEYGTLISKDPDSFTFYDVDTKATVQLRFENVKKVKAGYGGYNSMRGRHTDRTKSFVAGIFIMGGLIALVLAAASAK